MPVAVGRFAAVALGGLLWVADVAAAAAAAPEGAACRAGDDCGDSTALLQVLRPAAHHGHAHHKGRTRGVQAETCAALANHGSHFTVDVEVGTPGQRFSVVADTGSNALIVPSCVCHRMGHCSEQLPCFSGGDGRSSSFHLVVARETGRPVTEVVTFGSGKVAGVVAEDRVRVGNLSTFMKEGLLLMVDQALNTANELQGILGLGPPQPSAMAQRVDTAEPQRGAPEAEEPPESGDSSGSGDDDDDGGEQPAAWGDADAPPTDDDDDADAPRGDGDGAGAPLFDAADGGDDDGGDDVGTGGAGQSEEELAAAAAAAAAGLRQTRRAEASMPRPQSQGEEHGREVVKVEGDNIPKTSSFLEQAGVRRFSMCFTDGVKGVLRMGGPERRDALPSIGTYHWGVDLQGISVGGGAAARKLAVCDRGSMRSEQKTACGLLPDSGTTLLLGPEDQVVEILGAVCDGWEKCSSNYTETKKAATATASSFGGDGGLGGLVAPSKAAVLQAILQDCPKWLGSSEAGIERLPPIRFHVGGEGAAPQVLEISAADYILKFVDGSGKGGVISCAPAVDVVKFETKTNGPVWIAGMPLFFAYRVAYDAGPPRPRVAFDSVKERPCGSCGAGVAKVGLLGADAARHASGGDDDDDDDADAGGRRQAATPRELRGPPRRPTMAPSAEL